LRPGLFDLPAIQGSPMEALRHSVTFRGFAPGHEAHVPG
jgi:hypothetical protein